MDSSTVTLWRRVDAPGHDAAVLAEGPTGATFDGVAVFLHDGKVGRLAYRVVCDPQWRTLRVRVTGSVDATSVDVALTRDEGNRWSVDGSHRPELDGCDDVDLSFTPATNTLPIRRLKLAIGERADVAAAWLRFPSLTVERLPQVYARLDATHYRYESRGGAFVATLETDGAGLVVDYPGIWRSELHGTTG